MNLSIFSTLPIKKSVVGIELNLIKEHALEGKRTNPENDSNNR